MPPKDTIWQADPHTLAKIRIVEEYLKAWFPIISRYSGRVIYIDGFCGPGQYKSGEKGSPIIALETALFHQHDYLKSKELIFLFIDIDKNRIDHLSSIIEDYEIPDSFKIKYVHGNFKGTLQNILNKLESKGHSIAPTFLFIDPFGIKEASYELIKQFMENPKCEVLINFMAEPINRFAKTPEFEQHLNELFGTTEWKLCFEQANTYECFISLYEIQLKKIFRYCWSFEMKDMKNKTKYLLFFGTNHLTGLEKMKDAMWKIDPTGDYEFSDRHHTQLTIFNDLFDQSILINIFLNLEKKSYVIEEIEHYTISQTPFRKAHVRVALNALEKEKLISVKRPGRHGYPIGTKIKFL